MQAEVSGLSIANDKINRYSLCVIKRGARDHAIKPCRIIIARRRRGGGGGEERRKKATMTAPLCFVYERNFLLLYINTHKTG